MIGTFPPITMRKPKIIIEKLLIDLDRCARASFASGIAEQLTTTARCVIEVLEMLVLYVHHMPIIVNMPMVSLEIP